ncbi:hypothetical protein GCM10022408_20820 [Hymenobacter fastidiosus]|uniref:DUF5004 domain-containing protein n=2 Tax=Hymenobacter fastidiosus TaxID=486264 RepID=A0ABP7S993_9BACT
MSFLLGLAAAALSFTSCQKELDQVLPATQESAAALTQSKNDLLTASPWHLAALTSSVAATASQEAGTVDMLARLKPWVRDNVFTYAAGGSYTANEAEIKIHPQTPQQLTGTWQLSAPGDSLTVTQENVARHYAVAELTGSTLRLNYTQAGKTTSSVYSH